MKFRPVRGVGTGGKVYALDVQLAYILNSSTLAEGIGVRVNALSAISASGTYTDTIGVQVRNQAASGTTQTRTTGIHIEDQSGSGANYLIFAGALLTGTPVFRVDSGNPPNSASATLGDSNMYLLWTENGAQTLRQVRWEDSGASGGAGISANRKLLYAV